MSLIIVPNQFHDLQDIQITSNTSSADAKTQVEAAFNDLYAGCVEQGYMVAINDLPASHYYETTGSGNWTWTLTPRVKKILVRGEGCVPDTVDDLRKFESNAIIESLPNETCNIALEVSNIDNNYDEMNECVLPYVQLSWQINIAQYCSTVSYTHLTLPPINSV